MLLSSHDMDEVEEICDNVTIMKRGSVAYHGTIADLRRQAPPQAHLLHTDDNHIARLLAQNQPGVTVGFADDQFAVRGDQVAIDRYVGVLVDARIAIRSLTLGEAPLEALFFMLTESAPDHADQLGTDRAEVAR